MEVLFEETYDFESYEMDGNKVTTAFVNKAGVRMWELRQGTQNMLVDVVPSGRGGYGDALRISTNAANGTVFYANNNGTGNYLPERKEGLVVLEHDFLLEADSLPTKESSVMCQMMTTVGQQFVFPYVIRRQGDDIQIMRDANVNSSPAYAGPFPCGQWFKMRAVFDYTTGKWFSEYIDPQGESHWLANGSNIPPVFLEAGVRSVRTTYTVTNNTADKSAQMLADNFRYYSLEGMSTASGFTAVKQAADIYSAMPNLTGAPYSPKAAASFKEDFSTYMSVPTALEVGNGKTWSSVSTGAYYGGSVNVTADPDAEEQRALFFHTGDGGPVSQAAHAWLRPMDSSGGTAGAVCFDGRVRVADSATNAYAAITTQDGRADVLKLLRISGGDLYLLDTYLMTVEPNQWYEFSMLLNAADDTVFASVSGASGTADATVQAEAVCFENPLRITVGAEYAGEAQAETGVYFGNLAVYSASECTVTSELLLQNKPLQLKPKIDLHFSNFVNASQLNHIVLTDGQNETALKLEFTGNAVKTAVIEPEAFLKKNTSYRVVLSAVEDVLGNVPAPAELAFQTGDPAVMDIMEIGGIFLTVDGSRTEYLKDGTAAVGVKCRNVATEETETVLILALYRGYVMEKIVVTDGITVAPGVEAELSANISIPAGRDYRLRVCLWNSMEEQFALAQSCLFDKAGMVRE